MPEIIRSGVFLFLLPIVLAVLMSILAQKDTSRGQGRYFYSIVRFSRDVCILIAVSFAMVYGQGVAGYQHSNDSQLEQYPVLKVLDLAGAERERYQSMLSIRPDFFKNDATLELVVSPELQQELVKVPWAWELTPGRAGIEPLNRSITIPVYPYGSGDSLTGMLIISVLAVLARTASMVICTLIRAIRERAAQGNSSPQQPSPTLPA